MQYKHVPITLRTLVILSSLFLTACAAEVQSEGDMIVYKGLKRVFLEGEGELFGYMRLTEQEAINLASKSPDGCTFTIYTPPVLPEDEFGKTYFIGDICKR
jgi:hypothetical protein